MDTDRLARGRDVAVDIELDEPTGAYISDFIRDARGGGCSVGTPPAYLGFRLVRDDGARHGLQEIAQVLGLAAADP